MIVVGVDPGAKGGIAIYDTDVEELELIAARSMADVLNDYNDLDRKVMHVFVEKAQAFPGQGVSAMFNYGTTMGRILGALEALFVAYTLVTPKQWQKTMWEGTDTKLEPKQRSLQAVRRLFPRVNLLASEKCRRPHDGLVDALLICEYGRRSLKA